ncbi:MAG: hypothetical protein CVU05_05910 [Bacteroidetes bacterium HGW-Bacteroidetes-21]|jgi:hypothetical protein|nr:MAG: hypothetical protein CVU05_05910 [Bacteroidetes bacterium HGW-Bacteroidetes-21]
MRRITVIVSVCLLFTIKAFCQPYGPLIFSEGISFEGNTSSCLRIDTSQTESIWIIGQPSKIFFDSAYSVTHAILTDSLNYYPPNNNSYFDLIIKNCSPYWWGEGIISFWHKYDTDTLRDGGYIEISYDGGNSWKNIIDDNTYMDFIPTNFYTHSDTLFDSTPAFSGHSDDWQYSQIYWFWDAMTKPVFDSLIVRFNFRNCFDFI